MVAAIAATIWSGGCFKRVGITGPSADQSIPTELRYLNSTPLHPSPDGSKITFFAQNEDFPFGVEVREAVTGRILRATFAAEPFVRVTWRPDGKVVAYFNQESTTERKLTFWDLESDRHVPVSTPVTHNQYDVKWAPDGLKFAFTSDAKEFVVIGPHLEPRVRAVAVRRFAWSGDGKRIAVIPEGNPSQIVILDARTLETQTEFSLGGAADLVSVEWTPFENLLLRSQDKKKRTSDLYTLDPNSSTVTRSIHVAGEASDPRWCPDGQSLLWSAAPAKGWQKLILADADGKVRRVIGAEGHVNFRGFLPDGHSLMASVISPAKNQLVRVNFSETEAKFEVVAGADTDSSSYASHHMVSLPATDGFEPSFFVSEVTDRTKRTGAVIIRAYGGEKPQYAANWGEIQLYLRHGISYISVPNLPSHGAANLIAACQYARKQLGCRSDLTVVYGTSTGAAMALEAAIEQPSMCELLVLVGLVSEPATDRRSHGGQPGRVFAFHGALDPIPPEYGKRILDNILGPEATRSPRGLWHVFPGEPHALSRADGTVHATIMEELAFLRNK